MHDEGSKLLNGIKNMYVSSLGKGKRRYVNVSELD